MPKTISRKVLLLLLCLSLSQSQCLAYGFIHTAISKKGQYIEVDNEFGKASIDLEVLVPEGYSIEPKDLHIKKGQVKKFKVTKLEINSQDILKKRYWNGLNYAELLFRNKNTGKLYTLSKLYLISKQMSKLDYDLTQCKAKDNKAYFTFQTYKSNKYSLRVKSSKIYYKKKYINVDHNKTLKLSRSGLIKLKPNEQSFSFSITDNSFKYINQLHQFNKLTFDDKADDAYPRLGFLDHTDGFHTDLRQPYIHHELEIKDLVNKITFNYVLRSPAVREFKSNCAYARQHSKTGKTSHALSRALNLLFLPIFPTLVFDSMFPKERFNHLYVEVVE